MAQSQNSTIKKSDSSSNNGADYDNDKKHKIRPQNSKYCYLALIVLAVISLTTIPSPFQPVGEPSLWHVWYYGWITALSTGLGVLPLVFAPDLDSYWVGISNGESSAISC